VLTPRGSGIAALVVIVSLALWLALGDDGDRQEHRLRTHASAPATRPTAATAASRPDSESHNLEATREKPQAKGPARHITPGDLLISGIDGLVASPELLRRVRSGAVAGVILMGTNIDTLDQVRALTRSLHTAAREGGQPPLLVMVDQEGGTVRRFRSARPRHSARELAALPLRAVENEGLATGRDLLERGANVDLAPVVDVVRSAANFLGSRAFARDADAVARNACRFASGLRQAGIVPTLKHFPGLGGAGATNTDFAAVAIDRPLGRLREDWASYDRCGRSPNTLIMVASASYPALTSNTPAVLSRRTYVALRELGVKGPVITDALGGQALATEPDVAVRAVRAGADLLLFTTEQPSVAGYQALRDALQSHRISLAMMRDRAMRVRSLRRTLIDTP
jgi:beta-N-acetylhexosaminidase